MITYKAVLVVVFLCIISLMEGAIWGSKLANDQYTNEVTSLCSNHRQAVYTSHYGFRIVCDSSVYQAR